MVSVWEMIVVGNIVSEMRQNAALNMATKTLVTEDTRH